MERFISEEQQTLTVDVSKKPHNIVRLPHGDGAVVLQKGNN